MSEAWKKGKDRYQKFMTKQKKGGKTHAEALEAWKSQKEGKPSKKSTKSVSVSPQKRKSRKKKETGFQRPKSIWEKISRQPALRKHPNMATIKRKI